MIHLSCHNSCGEVIKTGGMAPLPPPISPPLQNYASRLGSDLMWVRSHFSKFWDFRSYSYVLCIKLSMVNIHMHFKTMTGRYIRTKNFEYLKSFLILPLESIMWNVLWVLQISWTKNDSSIRLPHKNIALICHKL